MNFAHPHFAEPDWLWLALLAPAALIALLQYAAWARRHQLSRFAAGRFIETLTRSHSPARRFLKNVLLVLAVAGIGAALARPQWGESPLDATQLLGEDLVFAVDCSRSMLATDVAPSRMERARLAVTDFVRRRPRGRVGLVAFAGQAFLQCPLTFDFGAFEDSLNALDDKTIPVPGTDIGRALSEAFQAMDKTNAQKVVILLTDGEDLEKGGIRIAEILGKEGLRVFAIGIGAPGGSEIQFINEQGQPDIVRDSNGQVVRTHLDETTLRTIALATHGNYYPLGPLGEGLAKTAGALESLNAAKSAVPTRKLGVDRFHLFIGAALVLLGCESLIGTRRRM